MQNQWEVWSGHISNEICDQIINDCLQLNTANATVGFDDNRRNDEHRRSTLRWLDVYGQHSWIADIMMRFTRASNRNNFGFDITHMNEIQFTEYHGSNLGKYEWHHDVDWENKAPFDRKLSVVIQLSHPHEYEGGSFEFFGMPSPDEVFKPRGSVLVFPSFFLHRVNAVTAGTRYSLVSWVEGPKFR